MVEEEDTRKLAAAGWSEKAIWEITALTSFFNFSGRMEAASGLPQDEIPEGARLAEAGAGQLKPRPLGHQPAAANSGN